LSQAACGTAQFSALKEVIDTFLQENVGALVESDATAITSLSVEFTKRFEDFCSWRSLSCIVTTPAALVLLLTFTGSWMEAGFQKKN